MNALREKMVVRIQEIESSGNEDGVKIWNNVTQDISN